MAIHSSFQHCFFFEFFSVAGASRLVHIRFTESSHQTNYWWRFAREELTKITAFDSGEERWLITNLMDFFDDAGKLQVGKQKVSRRWCDFFCFYLLYISSFCLWISWYASAVAADGAQRLLCQFRGDFFYGRTEKRFAVRHHSPLLRHFGMFSFN